MNIEDYHKQIEKIDDHFKNVTEEDFFINMINAGQPLKLKSSEKKLFIEKLIVNGYEKKSRNTFFKISGDEEFYKNFVESEESGRMFSSIEINENIVSHIFKFKDENGLILEGIGNLGILMKIIGIDVSKTFNLSKKKLYKEIA